MAEINFLQPVSVTNLYLDLTSGDPLPLASRPKKGEIISQDERSKTPNSEISTSSSQAAKDAATKASMQLLARAITALVVPFFCINIAHTYNLICIGAKLGLIVVGKICQAKTVRGHTYQEYFTDIKKHAAYMAYDFAIGYYRLVLPVAYAIWTEKTLRFNGWMMDKLQTAFQKSPTENPISENIIEQNSLITDK